MWAHVLKEIKEYSIALFQAIILILVVMIVRFREQFKTMQNASTAIYFLVTSIIVLVLFSQAALVEAHQNGAPKSRCDSMVPGHWVSAQKSLSPYQILVDKTVIRPGDRVNITLKTIQGQIGFKGFFVMVKEAESDDEETGEEATINNAKNYGFFDLASSEMAHAQPVHCFDNRNSAMTHVVNYVKDSVELFWIAPKLITDESDQVGMSDKPYIEKELKVVATFVKDFWTFWSNVEPVGDVRLVLTDTFGSSSHPKFQTLPSPNSRGNFPPMESSLSSSLNSRNPVVTVISSSSSMSSSFSSMPVQLNRQGSLSVTTEENGGVQFGESSSWNNFKRAWNLVTDFFGSSSSR